MSNLNDLKLPDLKEEAKRRFPGIVVSKFKNKGEFIELLTGKRPPIFSQRETKKEARIRGAETYRAKLETRKTDIEDYKAAVVALSNIKPQIPEGSLNKSGVVVIEHEYYTVVDSKGRNPQYIKKEIPVEYKAVLNDKTLVVTLLSDFEIKKTTRLFGTPSKDDPNGIKGIRDDVINAKYSKGESFNLSLTEEGVKQRPDGTFAFRWGTDASRNGINASIYLSTEDFFAIMNNSMLSPFREDFSELVIPSISQFMFEKGQSISSSAMGFRGPAASATGISAELLENPLIQVYVSVAQFTEALKNFLADPSNPQNKNDLANSVPSLQDACDYASQNFIPILK